MISSSPQLEDFPELLQDIQLRLPVNEAARTSALSKAWLHAWSTIPTLRFRINTRGMGPWGMKRVHNMDRILTRYLRENIPMERFDLDIALDNKETASLANECIRTMATKSCTLKELSLSYEVSGTFSNNLPHEILSCPNLTKIRVLSARTWRWFQHTTVWMTSLDHVIIKCISLHVLYLENVNISQELLDGILSSCRLLMEISLKSCSQGLNTIKVKNLPCLNQLRIVTEDGDSTTLEINHVPNLHTFTWERSSDNSFRARISSPDIPFSAHSLSLGSSLKDLSLGNMVSDDGPLDKIISGAPFLESLTLIMKYWEPGSFHLTCASIKRLSLRNCSPRLIDVQVYAPNLVFCYLGCNTMPSLLFPVSTLIKQTKFWLDLTVRVDASFFLKLREALALSSNCDLHITTLNHESPPFDIDIDDLRTRLPLPSAMKVERMYFQTFNDQCMWEGSRFFDAFFEICHPNHVIAMGSKNYFCKVMISDVLEKKTTTASWSRYLKQVQISKHTKWETLTNSHKSFLESVIIGYFEFRLDWH